LPSDSQDVVDVFSGRYQATDVVSLFVSRSLHINGSIHHTIYVYAQVTRNYPNQNYEWKTYMQILKNENGVRCNFIQCWLNNSDVCLRKNDQMQLEKKLHKLNLTLKVEFHSVTSGRHDQKPTVSSIGPVPGAMALRWEKNKKFWEELIAYFPLIRHGPHRKRRR
jgi:hypothetical protein